MLPDGVNKCGRNSFGLEMYVDFKLKKLTFTRLGKTFGAGGWLLVLLLFFCAQQVYATTTDNITPPLDSLADSTKPKRVTLDYTLNWDARSSFIDRKLVNIWGVNTGLKFGRKRHELTLGYYWLTFNSLLRLVDLRKDAAQRINLDYYTKTDLYYFSLMYWPNLVNTRKWRVSLPVELGIGATQNTGQGLLNELTIWRRNDFFLPAQLGLNVKWRATRWVGLSATGGYRYAIYQQNIPNNYNGAYYSAGFSIEYAFFEDSYYWIRKKLTRKKPAEETKAEP